MTNEITTQMSGGPLTPALSPKGERVRAALGAEELAGLFAALKVSPHPMLALPTLAWVQALLASRPDDWKHALVEFLNRRQRRIQLAEEDPLWWGWELEPWADSDRLLLGTYVPRPLAPALSPEGAREKMEAAAVLGIYGGNRASKSVYAVKRGCQTAVIYPRSTLAMLSESEASSIKTVQALVWAYLKPHYGTLNGKRDSVFKINYSQANGFTDRKLVLPNGSEIHFLTYNQDPGDYEGWEFGAPAHAYAEISAQRRKVQETEHPSLWYVPANIGAVADESMPLSWLKMFSRRLKYRQSKLLWPFTPVKGITPAIKEMVGNSARTVESRPAELLPRQNFPDCPKGHMPYIRECVFPGVKAMAIYYFTLFNKFGPSPGRTYYDEVKALCDGKASEYIERVAYGMARDSVARAFPKFGAHNIVRREHLPAVGTNYFFTDPAGARNWASLWVRVTPAGDHYIYRDWPDCQTFGEWAVPTEREVNESNRAGWDGDPGPAQSGMGYGTVKYKQTFLEKEEVRMKNEEADPYRKRLQEQARKAGAAVSEEIAERYIDPRAGASEHHAEQGGTCIIDEFAEEQKAGDGSTVAAMEFIPASGVNEDEGLNMVNELLDWNPEQPLVPILNAPKLYVCADALQVVWMFENFTGRGGAKGACKDFADLVRYMALAKLEYQDQRYQGKPGRGN